MIGAVKPHLGRRHAEPLTLVPQPSTAQAGVRDLRAVLSATGDLHTPHITRTGSGQVINAEQPRLAFDATYELAGQAYLAAT
jgi:hypothetical protein